MGARNCSQAMPYVFTNCLNGNEGATQFMRAKPKRPIPVPNTLTQPFWEASKNGQLAIQRCQECGHYYHPPISVCTECYSGKLAFEPVSGKGRIHTRTIMYDPRIQGFAESVPFAVISVELDEQPGLLFLCNLLDVPAEEAIIGRRVEVAFEPMEGGFVLPQFRLTEIKENGR